MWGFSVIFLTWIYYSFIGGIVEVIGFFISNKKLALDRGFLIGPIIPIFGFGSLLIIWLVPVDVNIFVLFASCVFICGLLEFIVSYFMEKIFKLRWWDYSSKRFNIDGRIELINCLLFGVGGVIIIKFLQPLFNSYIYSIPNYVVYLSTILLFILVFVDFIISCIGAFSLKSKVIKIINADSYDLHKENVINLITSSDFFTKRLLKIFPNILKILQSIKSYDFNDKNK